MTAPAADVAAEVWHPAHVNVPGRAGSLVRAVEQVAARVGRSLDPAQRLAVDVLTSAKADGLPATLEAAVISPRQNLKTYILELITLARLLQPGGDRLAVWSAHEVSTAQETLLGFLSLAERSPWLADRIEHVGRSTGREFITFRGKRRLRFKARIKTGGRGLAGDLVVLDEAFALQPEHIASLLPILSTRRRGQVFYGSSAPLAGSTILHGVVRRGRAGGSTALAYAEWCAPGSLADPGCASGTECRHAPGTDGCVMDDERMWLAANPAAVFGRISMDYLRQERVAMPPANFAAERLGWAESSATADVLPLWDVRVDRESTVTGRPVFTFDVAPDSRSAAVGVVGARADGRAHVEVVAHEPGTAWLPRALQRAAKKHPDAVFACIDMPHVVALLPGIKARGVTVQELSKAELAAGCSALQRAVADDTVRHLGDPILSAALAGAARADVGDGAWVWARRRSDVDISPLIAVTAGLWVHESAPVVEPMVAWR